MILTILSYLAVALVFFCLGGFTGLLMAHRLVGIVLNRELAAKLGEELRKQRKRDALASYSVMKATAACVPEATHG